MLLTVLVCGVSLATCARTQPVEPVFDTVGSSYYCGRVQFTITSPTTVTPNWPDRPCNGNPPLAILSAGTMEWSEANDRTLTLPLRIINRGTVSVQTPIRLILPVGAKTVLNPAETPNSTMIPLNADSTRTDGTKVWLIGNAGTVAPSDSTAAENVLFQINSPVIEGRFVFTISGETEEFPAMAPSQTPGWFEDDSSYIAGKILKQVVGVGYTVSATLTQRKAAADSVGGVVIGGTGTPFGYPGVYYLKVAGAITTDSLAALVAVLRRQPGVRMAIVLNRVRESWRKPYDGTAWRPDTFRLNPDQASPTRAVWPFEATAAPMAWGCSVGSSAARLALIDTHFGQGDYSKNITSGSQPNPLPGAFDPTPHGSVVANLMAARGNDSIGMSGMSWYADLRAYSVSRRGLASSLAPFVMKTMLDSADAVNLSLGTTEWPLATDQEIAAVSDSILLVDAILAGEQAGLRIPLFVVSAGNDNQDAKYNGFARAKLAFPTRFLVVGASTPPGPSGMGRWGGTNFTTRGTDLGSNFGSLIDLYAPGVDIFLYSDSLNSFSQVDGTATSWAAPFVTGTAGLLRALVPTLQPSELKGLILQGAQQGGHRVIEDPSRYVLNAYEALKAAAAVPGRPLCGNRLWVENLRSVVAERGGSIETIYTHPTTDTLGLIFPRHGGRTVNLNLVSGGGEYHTLQWSAAGSWFLSPPIAWADSLYWGTTWSFLGRTHNGDSLAGPREFQYGGQPGITSAPVNITLGTSFGSGRLLGNFSNTLTAPIVVSLRRNAVVDSAGNFVRYDTVTTGIGNTAYGTSYQSADFKAFPSPLADRVFVVYNRYDYPVSPPTAWVPGPNATPIGNEWSYQIRSVSGNTLSGIAEVWSVPWGGGTATQIWSRPSRTIRFLGLAEFNTLSSHEAVVGVARIDGNAAVPFTGGVVQCEVEYVNVLTGAVLRTRTAPNATCSVGQIEISTFSPLRASPDRRGPSIPTRVPVTVRP